MAKPKPDKIIRYEHVLGKVERQQLEQASAAYSINRVLSPLVTLLNDVTGVATVLGLLAVGLGFKYDVYSGPAATTAELIGDFADQARQAGIDAKNLAEVGQAAATSWWSNYTDPMTYATAAYDYLTPLGTLDRALEDIGLPTVLGTWSTGVSNMDLSPNFGDPWFGLDLNPFN